MGMRFRPTLALAALLACSSIASAQATLKVGDPAPPLKVGRWVKGTPVEKLQPGTIYVLEFWATWCAPCKATMPHISQLQADHPEIVVIAQNVGEEDKAASKVEAWVADLGDKMNVRVATDDRSGEGEGVMWKTWNEAARAQTLPATMVVDKEGKLAWIGRPRDVDKVVKGLLAGTFDRAAEKVVAEEKNEKLEAGAKVQAEFNDKIGPLLQAKDYAGAAKAIDETVAAHPEMKGKLRGTKFGILLRGKLYDEAYLTADEIAADAWGNARTLNNLAYTIVDAKGIEKRDYARAEKFARRAVELSENKHPAMLDTLARVYADQGQHEKAVEFATKAVDLYEDGDEKVAMQKTLESYKAKLDGAPTTAPAAS
jgi:thiol-disulfide isomerase/thioredoxin